jgi:hypothetical protein
VTETKAAKRREVREEILLWLSSFTPVAAWIAAQQIGFILSPWVCATGHRWVLSAVMGGALAAAAAGGAATWRAWNTQRNGRGRQAASSARRRFVATGGLLLAAVFLIAIVALAVPTFIHRPCD